MAFYRQDPQMNNELSELLDSLESEGRPGLKNSIAITWIRYETANPIAGKGFGASWSEERLLYPASVVKLFYAAAVEAWLIKDLIPESKELTRATKDMLQDSSNDATSLVLDLLTGTTSGPSLTGQGWDSWKQQRQLVNHWLKALDWEELKQINCCQKTWSEGPYGREQDFYGTEQGNRNAISTIATARMLESIMTGEILSPRGCKRLREYLSRSLDVNQRENDPENQVDGFIGEGLPKGSKLWSKAGLMSQARHDAAWFCLPNKEPMLLVVFSLGNQRAKDISLLPLITKRLSNFSRS